MENNNKQKYKEMLVLKGIGSELSKMAYPQMNNLNSMLEVLGYVAIKNPNKHVNQANISTTVGGDNSVTVNEYKDKYLLLDQNNTN
jgi:hypothetical protein